MNRVHIRAQKSKKIDTDFMNDLLEKKGFHIFAIELEEETFNIVFGDCNHVKTLLQRVLSKDREFAHFLSEEAFIHSHFFEHEETGLIVDVTHLTFRLDDYNKILKGLNDTL